MKMETKETKVRKLKTYYLYGKKARLGYHIKMTLSDMPPEGYHVLTSMSAHSREEAWDNYLSHIRGVKRPVCDRRRKTTRRLVNSAIGFS